MTIVDLILGTLCAFRLTQLVVWDTILDPITLWLQDRSPFLDELLRCAHCVGVWCGALTALIILCLCRQPLSWFTGLLRIFLWSFALAGAVSMIQHATGWLDTVIPFSEFQTPPSDEYERDEP